MTAERAVLSGPAWAAVRDEAEARYPNEACGVLLGRGGEPVEVLEARPVANAESGRARDRYLLDPRGQLEAERDARRRGLDVLGYFHSHPDHPADASPTDLERSWEGVLYLIVSVRGGRCREARCWLRPAGDAAFRGVDLALPAA